jgi:predicted RNase H-like nuclease
MSASTMSRGARLPYKTLAGAVPCPSGWLAATAKLQGITLSPEEPKVFPTFLELLDYKPAFQVIALFSPIGLLDVASPGGRSCDRAARRLLRWPRSGAVASAPTRRSLGLATYEEAQAANGGNLSIVAWRRLKKVAEVETNMAPYWQRVVFEVHPELSFYQLNNDQPVRFAKRSIPGLEERQALLKARLPGVDRILDAPLKGIAPAQLIDAAACLWTARRIMSRAVSRVPEDPEWDGMGLRMEYIR